LAAAAPLRTQSARGGRASAVACSFVTRSCNRRRLSCTLQQHLRVLGSCLRTASTAARV
jgi:hypothetical protein